MGPKYLLPCVGCGIMEERHPRVKKARCFECKKKYHQLKAQHYKK